METEKEQEKDASPEKYFALSSFIGSGGEQLSFSTGDRLVVHAKPSPEWWLAEMHGVIGYVPAGYLRRDAAEDEEDTSLGDPWQDAEYFGSYGTLKLHLEMLSDKSRTRAYQRVILNNSASLRNKVVMDVGCGTGIISMFCARLAQPSAVNSTSIQHLHTLVPAFKSVGRTTARVCVTITCKETTLNIELEAWPLAQQEFFNKPKFSHLIGPDDCLAAPCDVIHLDMYTLQVRDLEEIKGQFHFSLERSGVFHGFTAWFSVLFESLEKGGSTVELNTGPTSEPTHWKQTLFMLDRPVSMHAGDIISGTIAMRRNPVWRRHMTVTLHWNIKSSSQDTDNSQVGTKAFPMWR